MLNTDYPSIEAFERDATWENEIKGKSLNWKLLRAFPHKIDWNYFSYGYNIREETIREFKDHVNWKYISRYRNLSESFIKEFQDLVTWDEISTFQKLSEDFIKDFKLKVNWDRISEYQTLSEPFILEFEDKVNWKIIANYQKLSVNLTESLVQKEQITIQTASRYQKLSQKFIKENIEKLDMYDLYNILLYQNVSNDFIEENIKKINKNELSEYIARLDIKLIPNLLKKFEKYINWKKFSAKYNLSIELTKEYQDKLDWFAVSQSNKLNKEFVREFQNLLDWDYISGNSVFDEDFFEEFNEKVNWEKVGEQREFSLNFIRKHKSKIKNAEFRTDNISIIRELKDSISFKLIDYFEFSEDLLYEFKEKVDWELLIKKRRLSESLIDNVAELFGKWEWRWLSDIQPLSENFIRKYFDKVHWGGICMNQILSEEFIEEFDIGNQPFVRTSDKSIIPIFYNGKLCSPFHVWWSYILKYQKLSSEFSRVISSESWSERKFLMLPYQKNDFTLDVLSTLSEEKKSEYLGDTWLYKSTDFRKSQILNLKLFECYEDFFIANIIVDSNRYEMMNFHYQFNKNTTLEIFATQTDEKNEKGYSREKGFNVGTYENLYEFYNIKYSPKKYFKVTVKVYYEDVARIFFKNALYPIVRCKKLTVLD